MIESVFRTLLRTGVSVVWLVLAVLALRAALRNAPRRILCLLWALVAVRLVCPLPIESRVSLVPRPETVLQSVQAAEPAAAQAEAGTPIVPALSRVWLAGTAGMLLWALWSDLRLRRRVRASLPQGDGVFLCDGIDTPFVLGMIAPRICLPSGVDAADAAYVLAHERAHLARGDHWWKPLGWLLLSVYWFHPLVWLSYVLFCRDLELACDERVAAALDREGLAAYSEALLRCSRARRGVPMVPIAFGEVGVKTRVRAILRFQKPALRRVLAAGAAILAAAVLFLTEQPAAAAALPLPKPRTEDDWTIPLDERSDAVFGTPQPTPPAETAAPAAQRTEAWSAPAQQEAGEPDAQPAEPEIRYVEAELVIPTPTIRNDMPPAYSANLADSVRPGTSGGGVTPLIAGADSRGSVGPNTDFGVVQNGDTTQIRLYP